MFSPALFSSPNRLLATVIGVLYLLIGLLGFTVAWGSAVFATSNGSLLLWLFQVNHAQNVAHLLVGAALLLGGSFTVRAAKTTDAAVGAVLLLFGLVGLFIIGSHANVFALNGADNVMHFGSAVVLLAAGLGADKRPVATTAHRS